ncbi:hypothetical protein M0R45_020988 [Rubus argutus]|uniref:Uncharacterized protein n=1 Tax=Rubus argutus TaxID=59490 RepID=A0AAW1XBR1_RUBAR
MGKKASSIVRQVEGTVLLHVNFSVKQDPSLGQEVMGLVSATYAYRDYKFAKDCKWIPDDMKEEYLQNVKVVEKAMLRAVNESSYGREHIVPGILQFSFVLLESLEEGNHKELCNLSGMRLWSSVNSHPFSKARAEHAIIRLLRNLVQSYPYPMLEHVSRLKELLDYFTFMHGKVAAHLVTALLPHQIQP